MTGLVGSTEVIAETGHRVCSSVPDLLVAHGLTRTPACPLDKRGVFEVDQALDFEDFKSSEEALDLAHRLFGCAAGQQLHDDWGGRCE